MMVYQSYTIQYRNGEKSTIRSANGMIKGNSVAYKLEDGKIIKYPVKNGAINESAPTTVNEITLTQYQKCFLDFMAAQDGDSTLTCNDFKKLYKNSEEINRAKLVKFYRENSSDYKVDKFRIDAKNDNEDNFCTYLNLKSDKKKNNEISLLFQQDPKEVANADSLNQKKSENKTSAKENESGSFFDSISSNDLFKVGVVGVPIYLLTKYGSKLKNLVPSFSIKANAARNLLKRAPKNLLGLGFAVGAYCLCKNMFADTVNATSSMKPLLKNPDVNEKELGDIKVLTLLHKINQDETFDSVASKYAMNKDDLAKINFLENENDKKLFTQGAVVVVKKLGYTVKENETYDSIATKLKVNVDNLQQANSNEELKPGMTIEVPGTIYTVKYGDCYSKIAKSFNITIDELLDMNNLSVNSVLRPGQDLKILKQ